MKSDNKGLLTILGVAVFIGLAGSFVMKNMKQKTNTSTMNDIVKSNIAKRAYPVLAANEYATGWNAGPPNGMGNFPRYPALWNIAPAAPVNGIKKVIGGAGFDSCQPGFPVAY